MTNMAFCKKKGMVIMNTMTTLMTNLTDINVVGRHDGLHARFCVFYEGRFRHDKPDNFH